MPTTPDRPAESILGPITPIRCTEPGCHWACHGVPDKYADSRARIVREHLAAEHKPTPKSPDRPAAERRTTWPTAEPLQQAADLRRAAGDPLLADWLDATANALAWLAPYRDNEPGYGMWEAALAVARQLLGTSTGEDGESCGRFVPDTPRAPGLCASCGDAKGWHSLLATAEPAALPTPADRAAALREAAEVAVRAARACGESETGQYAASVAAGIGRDLRRLAGEAAAGAHQTEQAHRPQRGDAVAQWLRAQREAAADYPEAYQVTDGLLDLYRLHADMGIPLDGHACEARVIGDCECLETPAVPAAPEETQ